MNFGNCGNKHPNGYVNVLIDNTEKASTKDTMPFTTKNITFEFHDGSELRLKENFGIIQINNIDIIKCQQCS